MCTKISNHLRSLNANKPKLSNSHSHTTEIDILDPKLYIVVT